MTQFNFSAMLSQENQVKQIPVDMLVPYHNHNFTLYEGERLDDTQIILMTINMKYLSVTTVGMRQ